MMITTKSPRRRPGSDGRLLTSLVWRSLLLSLLCLFVLLPWTNHKLQHFSLLLLPTLNMGHNSLALPDLHGIVHNSFLFNHE